MKKRGQFYLIAVIFVVSMLIGFLTITNFSQKKDNPNLNLIKEELNEEVTRIIEYGICNNKTNLEIENLILDFTKAYTNNSNKNFYFILGDNSSNFTIASYQSNFLKIIIAEDDLQNEYNINFYKGYSFYYKIPPTNKITLKIDGLDYSFEIKRGINFYFIISYEQGGQKNIVIQK